MTRGGLTGLFLVLLLLIWAGYNYRLEKQTGMTLKEQNEQLQQKIDGLEERNTNLAERGMLQENQIHQLKKQIANLDTLRRLAEAKSEQLVNQIKNMLMYNNVQLKELKQALDSLQVWNYEHISKHDGQSRKFTGDEAGQDRQ